MIIHTEFNSQIEPQDFYYLFYFNSQIQEENMDFSETITH